MTHEHLKQLRKGAGLSQSKAADLVHVSQRSWARYESGDRHVPRGVLELFCMKIGKDVQREFPSP